MALSEADCREAFRMIASNVAVITVVGADGPHGCTATAWAEDPRSPFVMTALKRAGRTRALVDRSGRFCANALSAEQVEVARRFAKRGDRFAGVSYRSGSLGLPVIQGAVVALECELESTQRFGIYDLLVGRIEAATVGRGPGVLTYCDRSFGTHVPVERAHA